MEREGAEGGSSNSEENNNSSPKRKDSQNINKKRSIFKGMNFFNFFDNMFGCPDLDKRAKELKYNFMKELWFDVGKGVMK